jgi:hypothetical protein
LKSADVNSNISYINETCLEITKISVEYTYTDETSEIKEFADQNSFPTPSKGLDDGKIPLLWFIIIPLIALISIIIVVKLRKRK